MFLKFELLLFVLSASSIPLYSQSLRWQELPGIPFSAKIDDVFFINPYTGWTFSYNKVYKTTDAGDTWTLFNQTGSNSNRCIGFFDLNIGIIGQLNFNIPMTRTTNGGVNWADITYSFPDPKPFGVCGINIVNENTAYVCGAYYGQARAYKTTNKGSNWSIVFNDTSLARSLVDCYFWSPDSGIMAGGYNRTDDIMTGNSVVILTTNSGDSWTRVYQSTRTKEWCWKISFNTGNSKDFGVASIERSAADGMSYFLKTTNRGFTWTEHPFLAYEQEGIGFLNESTGWLGGFGDIGISSYDSTYETTDGGSSWHKAGWGRSINRVRFINDTLAFASGQRIYRYSRMVVGINNTNQPIPSTFKLYQNYPNPFNPNTNIIFDIPSLNGNNSVKVILKIYDQAGREIRELINADLQPGNYSATFDGGYFPSGVYFYKLTADDYNRTKRMVLTK